MLIGLYSLIGRMRLIARDEVLLAAEKVAESIVVSYSRPPDRFEDLYKLMREGRVDPLKAFTEACREERMVTLKRPELWGFHTGFTNRRHVRRSKYTSPC